MIESRCPSFERFGGLTTLFSGVAVFVYAIAFIVLRNAFLSALCLTLFGAVTMAPWIAMYFRLRETHAAFALFALFLGLVGAIGASVHGGYDVGEQRTAGYNVPTRNLSSVGAITPPSGSMVTAIATGVAISRGVASVACTRCHSTSRHG